MVENSNALPIEYELDEYRILSVLSTDRIGIFYKALDKYLETQVIIREYFPAQSAMRDHDRVTVNPVPQAASDSPSLDYDTGLQQFLEEVRALARLQEPAVAQVKRCFKHNNTIYMVLEHRQELAPSPVAATTKRESGAKVREKRKFFSHALDTIPEKISALTASGKLTGKNFKSSATRHFKNSFSARNGFGITMPELFSPQRLKIAGISIVALVVVGGLAALWLREPDDIVATGTAPRYVLKDGIIKENKENALPQDTTPALVSGAPAEARPSDAEAAEVEEIDDIPQLLKLAEESLNGYRLTTPEGNNAVYFYNRVSMLDPENQEAKQGLYEVATRYGWLAKREMNNSNHLKANRFLTLGLQIDPRHPRLLALKKELQESDRTQVKLR